MLDLPGSGVYPLTRANRGTTYLSVRVGSKVNLLLPELLQKLLAGAWQLHAHPLDAVAQLRGHGLNNGDGAVLIQIHLE